MALLSIQRLDELSVGLLAKVAPPITTTRVNELVPLVEWYWLKAAGYALNNLESLQRLSFVHRALQDGDAYWVDGPKPRAGLIRVRRAHLDDENVGWISFLMRFSQGARASGLSKSLAGQLTGVVKEMEDNIHCHSRRSRSGLVAFLSHDAMFEFVVVDSGAGVLATLREAPEFSNVVDHGTALQLAIGTGNSRFGTTVGRGWGFRDLTVGVANEKALIRFRSGDHLLELDGTTSGTIGSRRVQRAEGRGFMVAIRMHL